MKIALATPSFPKSIADGLQWLEKLASEAAIQKAEIVCFPESFIPGYPYPEFNVEKATARQLETALSTARQIAATYQIAIILPMDWYADESYLNVAWVISANGELQGYQAKTQLDPSEDDIWRPGTERKLFEINGVKFGIVICHEGFRYPELVRWAAVRGAQIVFHPHCAGSDEEGNSPIEWGSMANPYYEKAMLMRSIENTIYFASTNYSFQYPDSATSVISPSGECLAFQPYGEPGILVADLDLAQATGLLANRFKGDLYR
ncbi:carbon-nitrogen hydrolase family protein [Mucilaginibacter sp. dw_454]|uniref:carbon-nitrogen hydrolase family protein n=1 Tax=Mucilaginibacter sp. dw_454 TaxID=2720079 RepID=UPI001BD474F6|nr:carbon-nitrogen hydrolase family protein [Mucilaginibacter sp. dw_454]